MYVITSDNYFYNNIIVIKNINVCSVDYCIYNY